MITNNRLNFCFHLIQKLQNISFYPIHIFYDDIMAYPIVSSIDMDPFLCDSSLYQSFPLENGIVYDKNNQDIFYIFERKGSCVCIIGPLCLQILPQYKTIEYARAHHINNFFDFRITRSSITQAFDTLNLIFFILNQSSENECYNNVPDNFESPIDSSLQYITLNTDSTDIYETDEKDYDIQTYQLHTAEKDIPHTPYKLEEDIISAFQSSDKDTFYYLLNKVENYFNGDFAYSYAKYKEYSAVSLITILTRAAITGGTSPNDAYTLSDVLLYKISLCKNEQDYPPLLKETLDSFFKLMKKHNESKNQSLYVRNCKTYISHHLNKELSPEILASQLGISKNYLLHLFSKYENITLMQYILRERVMAAANMLKYSDYDIMKIASYFHFQTQSHFGVVFKKYMGMPPATYRKKNKPVGF